MEEKKELPNHAIILNEKDNVATALKDLSKGSRIEVLEKNKNDKIMVKVKMNISAGFKVGLEDIPKGKKIYKYGNVIGTAKLNIKAGERVHIENMSSLIK